MVVSPSLCHRCPTSPETIVYARRKQTDWIQHLILHTHTLGRGNSPGVGVGGWDELFCKLGPGRNVNSLRRRRYWGVSPKMGKLRPTLNMTQC